MEIISENRIIQKLKSKDNKQLSVVFSDMINNNAQKFFFEMFKVLNLKNEYSKKAASIMCGIIFENKITTPNSHIEKLLIERNKLGIFIKSAELMDPKIFLYFLKKENLPELRINKYLNSYNYKDKYINDLNKSTLFFWGTGLYKNPALYDFILKNEPEFLILDTTNNNFKYPQLIPLSTMDFEDKELNEKIFSDFERLFSNNLPYMSFIKDSLTLNSVYKKDGIFNFINHIIKINKTFDADILFAEQKIYKKGLLKLGENNALTEDYYEKYIDFIRPNLTSNEELIDIFKIWLCDIENKNTIKRIYNAIDILEKKGIKISLDEIIKKEDFSLLLGNYNSSREDIYEILSFFKEKKKNIDCVLSIEQFESKNLKKMNGKKEELIYNIPIVIDFFIENNLILSKKLVNETVNRIKNFENPHFKIKNNRFEVFLCKSGAIQNILKDVFFKMDLDKLKKLSVLYKSLDSFSLYKEVVLLKENEYLRDSFTLINKINNKRRI